LASCGTVTARGAASRPTNAPDTLPTAVPEGARVSRLFAVVWASGLRRERVSASDGALRSIAGDHGATNTVSDSGFTKHRYDRCRAAHREPTESASSDEGRLIQIGLRGLELGNNVVIDYGLWGREVRSALRQTAADVGARAEIRYSTHLSRAAETTPSAPGPSAANDVAYVRRGTRQVRCQHRHPHAG
jgi:hypothetical protein